MSSHDFTLSGARLTARASGALWWEDARTLTVSDLHLGKSDRLARRGGALLPPYETAETLDRLADEIRLLSPAAVICLGDSFDDMDAYHALSADHHATLTALAAGRRWIWISGNHDPAPLDLPGEHVAEVTLPPLTFRHEAQVGAQAEVSGHYHPKARIRGRAKPCFLKDANRVILPAFGAYTGGLRVTDPAFDRLFRHDATLLITGPKIIEAPRSC